MGASEENIAEAVVLEERAATLLKQSEVLKQQARELRAESMRIRELARRLRPQKRRPVRTPAMPKAERPRHASRIVTYRGDIATQAWKV